MWSTDSRCPRCSKKDACADRIELYRELSPLVNRLNTEPQFTDGPGDGILIIACNDFQQAAVA